MPPDLDRWQSLKDIFRRNRYELKTDFVIKDGKKHPCAMYQYAGAPYRRTHRN